VIDGHDRVKAAMQTGQATVPVTYIQLTEQEELYALATFDPVGALAATDSALLADLLAEVSTGDAAVQTLLDSLRVPVVPLPGAGGDEFDGTPTEGGTRCQPGDLWALGPHRLLCGDSTDAEDLARLMDGETAQLLLTSPPYGVGMEYEEATPDFDKTCALAQAVLTLAAQSVSKNGFAFVNFGDRWTFPKVMGQVYLEIFQALGWRWYDFRYWVRDSVALAIWNTTQPHALSSSIETLYTFQNGRGGYPVNDLNISKAPLWEASGSSAGTGHPAVMAMGIASNAVAIYTQRDDIVLDPFGGTGTTMVAAHRARRLARLMELSPIYCDLVLARAEAEGIGPIARVGDG
jgi:DNA modification methylase